MSSKKPNHLFNTLTQMTLLLGLLASAPLPVHAEVVGDKASYFRLWQGFQKPDLSQDQFLSVLPKFMRATVDLYAGRALNNYIVIIPPKSKPEFVPDELALVGLSSEKDYLQIRQTAEGQAYSAAHWDLFDKNRSSSVKKIESVSQDPGQQLGENLGYNLSAGDLDWAGGYNRVFIGTKRSELSSEQFLIRLKSHVLLAQKMMGPRGLKGYLIIANPRYEIAYLNWESKAAHDQAMNSEAAPIVFGDASQIMDTLMYEEAGPLSAGQSVEYGKAYSTLQAQQNGVKRALIIVTNHETLGSSEKKTGYYLSEVTHTYFELARHGVRAEFASLLGGMAPMDPSSFDLNDVDNRNFVESEKLMSQLTQTQPLEMLKSSGFSAIIFPGGHGTMWDLPGQSLIQNAINAVYDSGGVIAAVCHGPAAFVGIRKSDGTLFLKGHRVTSFSNQEEEAIGLTQVMPFLLESRLIEEGAEFVKSSPWTANVVRSGRLITGQNPASAKPMAIEIARALIATE